MANKLHAVHAPSAPVPTTPVTCADLPALRAALASAFVERDDAIEALLTAFVAREHAVILGTPGTAKSTMVRAMAGAFGLRYRELLFTRFTGPDEVFGPVKMSAYKVDSFARATENYLPGCQVYFADEVFKANASILNAMLCMLQERVFHNDGTPVSCDLSTCVGASNELPESEELAPLYDRFLVRVHVDSISDRDNFARVAFSPPPAVPAYAGDLLSDQRAAAAVTFPAMVREAYLDLKDAIVKAGFRPSDRRWIKVLSLVSAAAYLDGRASAEPDDLGVLEHALWSAPAERSAVAKVVQATINPSAARAVECLDAAREIVGKLPPSPGREHVTQLASANAELADIGKRLATLGAGRKVDAVRKEVERLHTETKRAAARAVGVTL
jgi:MoxR-like ATPase